MPELDNDNTNTSYQAKKNEQKEQEQKSAEKVGSLAARGALDYFTGGQAEKFHNVPVVGGALKKAENIAGKGIAKADKLTGGQLGKVSKKLDDAGLVDAAEKGLDTVGGSLGGGGAAGAGASTPTINGPQQPSPSLGEGKSLQNGNGLGGRKESPFSRFSGGNGDSDVDASTDNQSDDGGAGFDLFALLMKSNKIKFALIGFCAFAFFSVGFMLIVGSNDAKADGHPSGYGMTHGQSDYGQKLLEVAESQLGNNEADGSHAKYLTWLGFDPSAHWCAAFVSWCANETGIDETIIPHTASVSSFLEYFKKQGVFKPLSSGYEPIVGDLIIWKAKNSRGQHRSHIGIVKEYDKENDKLITIEGNSSDAVRENTYKFSTLAGEGVVGFASPDYPIKSDESEDGNISGDTITVPKNLGTYGTREFDLASTQSEISYARSEAKKHHIVSPYAFPENYAERKVQDLWIKGGAKHDSKGFCKLDGRYLIAATNTFGNVGDKIDFYMSNGTVLHTIKIDTKSQSKAWYDQHPADKWGHNSGKNIIEFDGKKSIGDDPYYALGLHGQHVVKAVTGKSVLK